MLSKGRIGVERERYLRHTLEENSKDRKTLKSALLCRLHANQTRRRVRARFGRLRRNWGSSSRPGIAGSSPTGNPYAFTRRGRGAMFTTLTVAPAPSKPCRLHSGSLTKWSPDEHRHVKRFSSKGRPRNLMGPR